MYFHTELHHDLPVCPIHLVPTVLPYSLKHSGYPSVTTSPPIYATV